MQAWKQVCWGPQISWSLLHFSSWCKPRSSWDKFTTNHRFTRSKGRLHGPWCKQPLKVEVCMMPSLTPIPTTIFLPKWPTTYCIINIINLVTRTKPKLVEGDEMSTNNTVHLGGVGGADYVITMGQMKSGSNEHFYGNWICYDTCELNVVVLITLPLIQTKQWFFSF